MSARRWSLAPAPGFLPGARFFTDGTVRAIVGREAGRWHISISVDGRYPTWDEIADARYDLIPEKCMMAMILPPPDEYVNLGGMTGVEVFHLWEIIDPGLPTESGFGLRSRERP